MLTGVRRLVNYTISIGTLLEITLVSAIPYLIIGAIVSVSHGQGLQQMQVERGGDALVAWVASVIAWPALLFSHSCGSPVGG
ncbi:hypothetical protein [Mycobacterium shimoidei]|uniref:hypothetical protein n=1 Tax=Mycobacterium shimoidei TaxID=29313 RepID=UPI000848BFE5|nr:hypothetical protein [Mycobacterium shimoidei]MCV7261296.1 hypothetical protein [Mycobacterium shimoidei]ODR07673.1 hypothetical protein BHQ16_21225 [Mycobacterium shimoidei]ORW83202.1 hypothetical protein AWC26_03285 [Mycobacterium shimoidei]